MTTRTPAVAVRAALIALITAVALSGCATPSSGGMDGMDHGSASTSSADHNSADVMFSQMMIPHHAQAIEMSDMLLQKSGVDQRVRDLAQRIKTEQTPEIRAMKGWLKGWNAISPSPMAGMDHGDGMMSESEMAELQNADGPAAGPLFLKQMVSHHQGAIAMAKTERKNGKSAEAQSLAKGIIASQNAEITEMKDLAATLG